jgi:hypothetical protein
MCQSDCVRPIARSFRVRWWLSDSKFRADDGQEHLVHIRSGELRSKISQLQLALDGRIRDHHRFLLDSDEIEGHLSLIMEIKGLPV